ncbi:MAG TPA: WD40 repeat domain-containing serine/threonine protein kinase [Myxococcaceae bacterium]|nr:WD40 repeat domain-containing serine/threonine protein kinase [Myxococcaceae bacterium]
MRLSPGARVGPYEVLASLGAGGMGEVYRARDIRLGRDVALKVISDGAALDHERLQRFEQEARLAGSLNHPNLVVVHDVGSEGGAPFLVTELLEGESLRHRLTRGRLPVRTALELGAQIAEGLAAAHARGIVHRDVKPENLFLTSDGRAKLLDFGIAKLTAPRRVEGTRNLLDTTLTPEGLGTQPGAVLGTPGYMSPEQVRGDPVDARTDIFSLGTVLYEMLAGAPAFPAKSLIESGHAILESEPPPLPESVPPSVDLLVRRCLEKEPARRFQSAADLAFDLGAARASTSGKARAIFPRISFRLVPLAAVLLLLSAMGLVTWWLSRRSALPELPTFERITFRDGLTGGGRFTPDGRVVFSASFEGKPEEVYAYVAGSPGLQPLGLRARLTTLSSKTGELGVLMGTTSFWIGHMEGTLARVPALGGVPRELAEDAIGADWTASGELVVIRRGPGNRMWIERPLGTKIWEGVGAIYTLRCSPDGEQIALLRDLGARSELTVLDRSNRPHVVLTSPPEARYTGLAWTPDGKRLRLATVDRSGTTLSSVSIHGDIRPLYRFPEYRFLFDLAADGTMIFAIWDWGDHLALIRPGQPSHRELAWLSSMLLVDLSLDGRTLLSTHQDAWGLEENAVLGATDGTAPKLLGAGVPLALSPDGRRVAMMSRDHRRLFLVPTGAGTTEEVPLASLEVGLGRWSRDGRRLWITARRDDDARFQLFPVDVATRKVLEPIAGSDVFPGSIAAISADDRWLAAVGADRGLIVYPINQGQPIRISSVQADLSPFPAGWTSAGELWVGLPGATPPRLVRLELPTGKITRSIDIDLRQIGGDELRDARMTPDESLLAVQYSVRRARLELVKGIPPDR